MNSEFSYRTRSESLKRFRSEIFDLLIIGGGITGAACARDAASRGLRVALVEKGDFASGTSSTSSKLVHGGLRYLENFEFKLVFEALSERAHLVRTSPNLVRWLKFYLPVYESDARGKNILSLGLWLYDVLSLLRAPHFHRRLSREEMLRQVPGLKAEGLTGGFTYYDASMWDDVLVIENARAAKDLGAAVANYVEAVEPLWDSGQIRGYICQDRETGDRFSLLAKRTVVCGGPFTDLIGEKIASSAQGVVGAVGGAGPVEWKKWLEPSRGVHLVFDASRFPIDGAMLMTHPVDGRVSFVIPRFDFGAGVVVVGTTDAPSPKDPSEVRAELSDETYLLDLLGRYFPELKLSSEDVISKYVGVRPLVDPRVQGGNTDAGEASLQKVSREHYIGHGPGGTVFVAGGKYTTARLMAIDIIDHALEAWEVAYWKGEAMRPPAYHRPRVDEPVNLAVRPEALQLLATASESVPKEWVSRYGADALRIAEIEAERATSGQAARVRAPAGATADPEGFPGVEAMLAFGVRHEMVMHLDDFYFRRQPFYLSRRDHGLPWAPRLAKVWAEEKGLDAESDEAELGRFSRLVGRRDSGYQG